MISDAAQSPGTIVVGVDGSQTAQNALAWAAMEAQRRHARLLIAFAGHASDRDVLSADMARAAQREVSAFGRMLLNESIVTIAENHPDVDAHTEFREDQPAAMLIDLSRDAELVVVGRGSGGRLARFLLGSVTQRISSGAHCPVIVVDDKPLAEDTVVVGVSHADLSREAMRFACQEAGLRGASVLAVRAWSDLDPPVTAGSLLREPRVAALHNYERKLLNDAVSAAQSEFPDLSISGHLVDSGPYLALLDEARKAALLVVGRHRHDSGLQSNVGPIASWVSHHAPCPLAIVPAHHP